MTPQSRIPGPEVAGGPGGPQPDAGRHEAADCRHVTLCRRRRPSNLVQHAAEGRSLPDRGGQHAAGELATTAPFGIITCHFGFTLLKQNAAQPAACTWFTSAHAAHHEPPATTSLVVRQVDWSTSTLSLTTPLNAALTRTPDLGAILKDPEVQASSCHPVVGSSFLQLESASLLRFSCAAALTGCCPFSGALTVPSQLHSSCRSSLQSRMTLILMALSSSECWFLRQLGPQHPALSADGGFAVLPGWRRVAGHADLHYQCRCEGGSHQVRPPTSRSLACVRQHQAPHHHHSPVVVCRWLGILHICPRCAAVVPAEPRYTSIPAAPNWPRPGLPCYTDHGAR